MLEDRTTKLVNNVYLDKPKETKEINEITDIESQTANPRILITEPRKDLIKQIQTQIQTKLEPQIQTYNDISDDSNNSFEENVLKIVLATLLLITTFPFIVCDLYYAYNDDSCVN